MNVEFVVGWGKGCMFVVLRWWFLVRFWVYWLQVWCVGFIVLGFHGCFVLGVVVTLVLLGAL